MAASNPTEVRFLVNCHEDWIEREGKPTVRYVDGVKAQISLLKYLLTFIAGSQIVTMIAMIWVAQNGR